MNYIIEILKCLFAAILTAVAPYNHLILILFFTHIVDMISAIRLNHRLYKLDNVKYTKPEFSSEKFKKIFGNIGMEFFILILAYIIQIWLFPTVTVVIFVSYMLISGQLISILENESEGNGQKWAVYLNRFFKNKASRYLGVDDLFDEKDDN